MKLMYHMYYTDPNILNFQWKTLLILKRQWIYKLKF